MFKRILGSPFLLRRLIRAVERNADGIERLEKTFRLYAFGSGEIIHQYPEREDDQDLSYTTDKSSWEFAEKDKRRVGPLPEE